MTFEEFQIAQDIQLIYETKQCFDRYNNPLTGGGDKPALLLEAQFYIQELGRREDSKIARRDFRMELIVIVLIGLELVTAVGLAILGSRQQTHDVNQQLAAWGRIQDVLSQLQTSSEATAQTLVSLQSTTQSMNERIGLELGRMAQMALDLDYNVEAKKADIINRGNVDLKLWGYRVPGEHARLFKSPLSLRRSEHAHPPNLIADMQNGKGTWQDPLEIYVRDDFGNEFIGTTNWGGSNMTGMFSTFNVTQSRWAPPK
jgi:hypothetical protein